MPRIFAYTRVSTVDQTASNQAREIEAAGFKIEAKRMVAETISGSVSACQRPGFAKLLDRMEQGDTLVVTKLDRLGRDTIDVVQTVGRLGADGIRVICLALGGVDLTSAAGRMTLTVLSAVAQFERDLIIERTQAGLARAKAEGKVLGRPSSLSTEQQAAARKALGDGDSVSAVAKRLGTSRQTILRARAAA